MTTPTLRDQVETPAKGNPLTVKPTGAQQVIARRMSHSRAKVPDFALRARVEMDAVVGWRAELRQSATLEGPAPSINDVIVKAVAIALRDHPQANGSYVEGEFQLHSRVNVGIAIAAPGTLLVPTIFDADVKSVADIAVETLELAARARAGKISPADMSGGTFTVTNLGMFGIDDFDAVVNEPQAAILAVGQVSEEPVVRCGDIVVRHIARLTLTCDHRILYGADAARFLTRVRELLQRPDFLMRPSSIKEAGLEVNGDSRGALDG